MIHEIYIAGFVDGEGYFGLKPLKNNYAQPKFTITNTHYPILIELREFFGWHKIYSKVYKTHKATGIYKQCWVLEISRRKDVLAVSKLLLPFLHVKHRAAEILIEYIQYRMAEGKLGNQFEEERLSLVKELKMLLHRNCDKS